MPSHPREVQQDSHSLALVQLGEAARDSGLLHAETARRLLGLAKAVRKVLSADEQKLGMLYLTELRMFAMTLEGEHHELVEAVVTRSNKLIAAMQFAGNRVSLGSGCNCFLYGNPKQCPLHSQNPDAPVPLGTPAPRKQKDEAAGEEKQKEDAA